jgi:hypothetical protein
MRKWVGDAIVISPSNAAFYLLRLFKHSRPTPAMRIRRLWAGILRLSGYHWSNVTRSADTYKARVMHTWGQQ